MDDSFNVESLIAIYSQDGRKIGDLFKTLLRDWVMNPCYLPDLYFCPVADDITNRPDFIDLHDQLETTLEETDYAYHPSAELTLAEMDQEPASKYDNPLPADFAGFSYHIPEEKWEQRALPEPFRKRINLVLQSNYPDYGYFCRALKSLVMYAFVPQEIKNRSITPLFRNRIQPIYEFCENKEKKLCNFTKRLNLDSLKYIEQKEFISRMIEHIEDRLSSVYQILEILRVLRIFEEY